MSPNYNLPHHTLNSDRLDVFGKGARELLITGRVGIAQN